MQKVSINQTVMTPLGEGVAQNTVHAQGAAEDDVKCLVRLPLNETTSARLRDVNCLTPHPWKSALFFFALSEVS